MGNLYRSAPPKLNTDKRVVQPESGQSVGLTLEERNKIKKLRIQKTILKEMNKAIRKQLKLRKTKSLTFETLMQLRYHSIHHKHMASLFQKVEDGTLGRPFTYKMLFEFEVPPLTSPVEETAEQAQ